MIGIFLLFQKQFKFVVFDPESTEAHGINSKFWLLLFYLVVGIGISLITRFVGDVFTFAYLIIPSSIGILLGKSVIKVFAISVLVGAILPPISLFLVFKFDFSSGPIAVVTSFILFLLVLGYKKLLALIIVFNISTNNAIFASQIFSFGEVGERLKPAVC